MTTLTPIVTAVNTININKHFFVETVNALEKQYRHDQKCAEAFNTILPNDYVSTYDNHQLTNQLVKILQLAMNDRHEHSWIEYYMYELDFGNKDELGKVQIDGKDIPLTTAEDLWEIVQSYS